MQPATKPCKYCKAIKEGMESYTCEKCSNLSHLACMKCKKPSRLKGNFSIVLEIPLDNNFTYIDFNFGSVSFLLKMTKPNLL